MKRKCNFVIPAIIISLVMSLNSFGFRSVQGGMLHQMPEYTENLVKQNHEWFNEEVIEILCYSGDAMEIGIYTARRKSTSEPFGIPEKIMAISGDVEAPALSGDEIRLYYHRLERGMFKVYRIIRKQHR